MILEPLMSIFLLTVVRKTLAANITSGLYLRIHNGSAGEYGGTFMTYAYTRKTSCGLQCSKTSGCWMWSHSFSTSVCRVYKNISYPMALSKTRSSFSTYGLAKRIVEGYYVPEARTLTMQNALIICQNMGMVVGYEPNVSVMKALHGKLATDTIFIGLKRKNSGGSVWVDGYENIVVTVNWEPSQPNNAGGNEDYTLSFNALAADIKLASSLSTSVPVICAIPRH